MLVIILAVAHHVNMPRGRCDFGIRCGSTSFADIFYNNCFKNGILPIKVTAEQRDVDGRCA